MIDTAQIDNWFSYHAPKTPAQVAGHVAVREAGKAFALVVLAHTATGADQTAAMRKIREAVMTANAAVASGAL